MEIPKGLRVSFHVERSPSKSDEKKKAIVNRRRMTKYIQIKNYINNDELSDYKQFVD